MSTRTVLLAAFLAVPAFWLHALAIPETTVTRTHVLNDIERSTITVAAGFELPLRSEASYLGDTGFGYVGYAPLDWLDFGIGAHLVDFDIYPSAELSLDVVDMFSDSSRFSLLLMAGVGGLPASLWFLHGGLGAVYQFTEYLQFYLGVGSDSNSRAAAVQAGVFVGPWRSLAVSFNAKLVVGPDGTELVVSLAPMLKIR
jgi:hypothetical protein